MFWDAPSQWREAQASLGYHLQIYAGLDEYVSNKALAIAEKIKDLECLLDILCNQTCPECTKPCCLHATVRYDFRDLVFLHLIQKGLPIGQLASGGGRGCSCLGENGCVLDRIMRPFMCTWYLCPSQMELARSEKLWWKYRLPERLREIQKDRKNLENAFLKLVAPNNTFSR